MPAIQKTELTSEELGDVIGWDIETWSVPLAFWNASITASGAGLHALEIGCGDGGLSLWLAKKGYSVVCSDVEGDFSNARALHRRYNLNSEIEYRTVNACDIPFEGHFDVVVVKSVLGAVGRIGGIESQRGSIEQMHKALRPGGTLLFAENLRASALHMICRKLFVRWGRSWQYLSVDDLAALFDSFASCTLRTTGFLAAFGRSEAQRNFLARIDRTFCNALIPASMKYVGYGVARK